MCRAPRGRFSAPPPRRELGTPRFVGLLTVTHVNKGKWQRVNNELICRLISSAAVYVLFFSLLVLRHSQMVGMVIKALKPTFNADSPAHAVLLVGGAPRGLPGVIPPQRGHC